ncbi:MAG TPA: cytochrome c maturation protein CcmE [Gemmatimonadaceae bacterium]|nr:cytochrome c maturation protein CcmE [Gemmatimonadaceae bacterium]
MTRRKSIIAGVVVLAAAFGWLLYGNLDKNIVFFLTPKELLAKGNEGYDVPLRLGGMVKAGTVNYDTATHDLRFMMTDGFADVKVHSQGTPPQMFRDSIGVVVEGRLEHDSVFKATNLLVKHSNEYHPPKAGEKPQEMYRSLIKGSGS